MVLRNLGVVQGSSLPLPIFLSPQVITSPAFAHHPVWDCVVLDQYPLTHSAVGSFRVKVVCCALGPQAVSTVCPRWTLSAGWIEVGRASPSRLRDDAEQPDLPRSSLRIVILGSHKTTKLTSVSSSRYNLTAAFSKWKHFCNLFT